MSRPRVIKIADVAARAGVSPATVSRVLNGSPRVHPALRARVEQVIATLGYRPDRVARALRRGGSLRLGLMLPDVHNPFFTDIVRGVEQAAHERGYLVMLCDADEDPARERQYGELLQAERVAGVVAAARDASGASLRPLLEGHTPLVLVDRCPDGVKVDAVVVDNRAGARAAVEHLLGLGLRRIGIITGPLDLSVARERLEGCREAMEQAGAPLDQRWVRIGDFKQSSGYAQTHALLTEVPDIEALFVSNNLMTLGALRALRELGRRVPQDLSIVSFDDMPWAESLNPPLTAVAQPAFEMGLHATRLLLERIEHRGGGEPIRRVLQPRLVVRASTAPPARSLTRLEGSC